MFYSPSYFRSSAFTPFCCMNVLNHNKPAPTETRRPKLERTTISFIIFVFCLSFNLSNQMIISFRPFILVSFNIRIFIYREKVYWCCRSFCVGCMIVPFSFQSSNMTLCQVYKFFLESSTTSSTNHASLVQFHYFVSCWFC